MLAALKSVPGVQDARVDFKKGAASKAYVSVGAGFEPQAAIEALKKESFTAKRSGR